MTYAERIAELTAEGLDHGDACGVADAEEMHGRIFDFDPEYPMDSRIGRTIMVIKAAIEK